MRSLSLIPSCRSNLRTRSSPGHRAGFELGNDARRSLIFAPRSACFHPRIPRLADQLREVLHQFQFAALGVHVLRCHAPLAGLEPLGDNGCMVLGRKGALAISSPKRAHSPHTERTVASIATVFSLGTSAPHNSQITNRARKD